MTYNPDFDLVMPEFRRDLVYGEEAETFLGRLNGVAVEVKRKRYPDARFYLETEQSPQRRGFQPSGLSTTRADYWAFVIASTGIVVLFPTVALARAAELGRPAAETDGDNPTRGFLLDWGQILSAAESNA